MKKHIFILSIFFQFFYSAAQEYVNIKGYVKDKETNEVLIGAFINCTTNQKITVSNSYGFFSINVPRGNVGLSFSFVGYSLQSASYILKTDTSLIVYLAADKQIEEVVILGNYTNKINSSQASVERISSKTVNSLPVLLGESDVLKSIHLMPGVVAGTEGSSGYYVRGGSSDQNLILIDGVPVYNAYHLYGFFSVFNTDAINDAKLYKGGMPARYGGRLSSVLDLRMKEGNANKFSGEVTAGLVSSKFMLEGPIVKGKTSFIITGRRSMTNLFANNLTDKILKIANYDKSEYYFYDFNTKINHIFSERSRLFFSFYSGKDNSDATTEKHDDNEQFQLYLTNKFKSNINWGNITTTLRWNYVISKNLFSNYTFYYTKYQYATSDEKIFISRSPEPQHNFSSNYKRDYFSEIHDYSGKIDFEYIQQNHSIKLGGQFTKHFIYPGIGASYYNTDTTYNSIDTSYNSKVTSNDAYVYLEDDFKFFNVFTINTGIHVAGYNVEEKLYKSVQPRISCSYHPTSHWSIKASYARMGQNLHLLSNSSLGLPTDLWVSSTKMIEPQYSDQFVLAYNYIYNQIYSFTLEVFNKYMYNLIAYKEGSSYFVEKTDWQDKVEKGKGNSYGVEFSINKEIGKLTGWISYTYSKSVRKFENINFGRQFPYKYDRTHDFTIALMYKFNEKYDIGSNWVYATGNAITLPNENISPPLAYMNYPVQYVFSTYAAEFYSSVNGFRMPPYHRLDVCFNYHHSAKYFRYTFSCGAYNVYNRKNPYYLYFTEGIVRKRLEQRSLFPVLPYVSLSLKF